MEDPYYACKCAIDCLLFYWDDENYDYEVSDKCRIWLNEYCPKVFYYKRKLRYVTYSLIAIFAIFIAGISLCIYFLFKKLDAPDGQQNAMPEQRDTSQQTPGFQHQQHEALVQNNSEIKSN